MRARSAEPESPLRGGGVGALWMAASRGWCLAAAAHSEGSKTRKEACGRARRSLMRGATCSDKKLC